MPKFPDLKSMSPDRWLSKLQQLRDEMLEEFEAILCDHESLDSTAARLEELFEEYALTGEEGESVPLLAVGASDAGIVFRHESDEEREVRIRPSDSGAWSLIEEVAGEEQEAESSELEPNKVAVRVLQLIPWWSEGAFADRVGRPEDFVDSDDR